MQVLLMVFGQG